MADDEGDGVLGAAEARKRCLQVAMHLPFAGRHSTCRYRGSDAVDCVLRRCRDVGMSVLAEVVIGGEIRDRSPVDRRRVAGAPIVQAVEWVANPGDVAHRLPDLQDLVLGERREIEIPSSTRLRTGAIPGLRSGGLAEHLPYPIDRLPCRVRSRLAHSGPSICLTRCITALMAARCSEVSALAACSAK